LLDSEQRIASIRLDRAPFASPDVLYVSSTAAAIGALRWDRRLAAERHPRLALLSVLVRI